VSRSGTNVVELKNRVESREQIELLSPSSSLHQFAEIDDLLRSIGPSETSLEPPSNFDQRGEGRFELMLFDSDRRRWNEVRREV